MSCSGIFFFNDTATTEIYTLSLHDALPISFRELTQEADARDDRDIRRVAAGNARSSRDRKSTRLNSSHTVISYAVFCLKKKNVMKSVRSAIVFNFAGELRYAVNVSMDLKPV